MSRLKEKYNQDIRPGLKKTLGFNNLMQVPEIKKITLNMGVGEILQDKKAIEKAQSDMEKLSGQKAVITRAKKSVASFKIREGMPIGVKVTLRRDRMYEFLDRLINIALPRVRDFRGLNQRSFDGNGNRLGYGGGYYDRTIKSLREINKNSVAIGLAFENQECSSLPSEEFDVPLDAILHNKGLVFFH